MKQLKIRSKQDYTVCHGSEKLWDLRPNSTNIFPPLKESQIKINTWTADHCACRIYKKHVGRVGFVLV